MLKEDIYSYTTGQESGFAQPIEIVNGWTWSFKDHIRLSTLYKNSQFDLENDNRDMRPYRNIIRPILNLQYRTEGFDVKDIEIYVDEAEDYYKSFLIDKFHEKWALEHELDTFIDDIVESYVDYGGVLVKNVDGERPEVVNLQSIAFCDQTNLIGGPFAIKHYFSPQELKEMQSKGWGEESNGATINIDSLIEKSEYNKQKQKDEKNYQPPGKYIEIYEIHGQFPNWWLKGESQDFSPQIHIIGFYEDQNGNHQGVTLFKKKETKLPFKFLARDGIYGRALGFGGIEELFESQIWTNFAELKKTELLQHASKVLYVTDDQTYRNKNKTINLENGEITTIQAGSRLEQINNVPRSITLFENALNEWQEHAQRIGAASEAVLGETPASGTPFRLYEAQLIENKSLHQWRQGKLAVFMDEIYRDWILPYIEREIVKDQEFLTELDANELQSISEIFVINKSNELIKEKILNGEIITQEEIELNKQQARQGFLRSGTKKFIQILKDEFKDKSLEVMTNIAGKQKNLALLTDKMVNVIRQFIATPEIRQDPGMVRLLNTLLESSGLSPIMFGTYPAISQIVQQGGGNTEPLQALAQQNA